MTDTVCRDCGRDVDLSHMPQHLVPPAERIQCSPCFVRWLKQHGIWSALPEDFVRAYKAKRKAAREAHG